MWVLKEPIDVHRGPRPGGHTPGATPRGLQTTWCTLRELSEWRRDGSRVMFCVVRVLASRLVRVEPRGPEAALWIQIKKQESGDQWLRVGAADQCSGLTRCGSFDHMTRV